MKTPEKRLDEAENAEIDYLKKVKKSSKKKVIATAAVTASVALLLFVLRLFYPGQTAYYDELKTDLAFENGKLKYTVSSQNEKKYITKVKAEAKSGEILLTVYCAPKSPLGKKPFSGEYNCPPTGDTPLTAVKVNGNTVWENGFYTDSTEYKLWKNKTPYCGDIAADLRIADTIGVYADLGSFTNELSTVDEPYKWHIFLKNSIEKEDESDCKKLMKNKACAILAFIENLDRVTFVYESNGKEKNFSVDTAEASCYVGSDIKSYTGSIKEIRELLDKLEIK